MTFRKVERLLLKDGWYLVNTEGSHYQYEHDIKKR